MDTASGYPDPTRRGRTRLPVLAAGAVAIATVLCLLPGCSDMPEPDKGANQSLVEIGERSLEEAEAFESQGRKAEAQAAYRRSEWAFRYHEHLTGEEPFLLEEATEGLKRTETRRRR